MRSIKPWILSVGLLAGPAGCSSTPILQPNVVNPPEVKTALQPIEIKRDEPSPSEVGKRTPKAETCLKAGECLELGGDRSEPELRSLQYARAHQAYQQALELDPTNLSATVRIARLYEKIGKPLEATASLEAALKRNPKDAMLWHELGMCWARQKNWNQAIQALDKAQQLEPRSTAYANDFGWTLARAGRLEESFAHFSRTHGEARAHLNLARMSKHMGQDEQCRKHLLEALKIDPHLSDARTMLAQMDPQAVPAHVTEAASSGPLQ